MTFKSKILAALTLLVFSTVSLTAQTDTEATHEKFKERAEKRANHRIEKLGLTDEEAVEFKAIHKKYREQLKEAAADVTSKEIMADMRYENHKAKTAEVKEFLTPEQYAIYDKFEGRKKRKGKRGKKERKGKRGI